MVTLIWDGPCAVTESSYGIALGYYVTCDDAVCRNCAPAGFASGDYSEWPGFEGWEDPLAILNSDESDSVTHCGECGAVIAHDLTIDGTRYVQDAIAEFISGEGHTPDVMAQWWDAYGGTLDESDLREIIERAMVAAGCTEYEPAPAPEPEVVPTTICMLPPATETPGTGLTCAECGEEMWIEESGVSHHWSAGNMDDIDYDADADHVPYAADEPES